MRNTVVPDTILCAPLSFVRNTFGMSERSTFCQAGVNSKLPVALLWNTEKGLPRFVMGWSRSAYGFIEVGRFGEKPLNILSRCPQWKPLQIYARVHTIDSGVFISSCRVEQNQEENDLGETIIQR